MYSPWSGFVYGQNTSCNAIYFRLSEDVLDLHAFSHYFVLLKFYILSRTRRHTCPWEVDVASCYGWPGLLRYPLHSFLEQPNRKKKHLEEPFWTYLEICVWQITYSGSKPSFTNLHCGIHQCDCLSLNVNNSNFKAYQCMTELTTSHVWIFFMVCPSTACSTWDVLWHNI